MTRRRARVTEDEVCRIGKALRKLGLPVSSVSFDGERVVYNIGDSGDMGAPAVDASDSADGLIREPAV